MKLKELEINLKKSKKKNFKIDFKNLDLIVFVSETGECKSLLNQIINEQKKKNNDFIYIPNNVSKSFFKNKVSLFESSLFDETNKIFLSFFPEYKEFKEKILNNISYSELKIYALIFDLIKRKEKEEVVIIENFENDMPPKLQQKLIDIINMVENSFKKKHQIFIATNSPFILNSVENNNIFYLKKEKNIIICKNGNDLYSTYGQPVERILKDIMGLETTRNLIIENKINELRNMVDNDKYETKDFKRKFIELKNILGSTDEDIFLLEMEIKKNKK